MGEPIGFLTSLEAAMKFFQLCMEAVTKEERIAILRELMTVEISTTEQFKEIVQDKKILMVRGDQHDKRKNPQK